MFGKLIFLFLTVAVVYAPLVPHASDDDDDDDDDETEPLRSKTPTNFHEACIMIGELRQDLNQKSKALKETYVALAPAALSEHVSEFLQKNAALSGKDIIINAINTTTQRVDVEMSELLSRADLINGGPKMKAALLDMADTYFVRCQFNLAFAEDEDENVKAFRTKLIRRDPEIDEHIFCRKITFLHVKT